MLYIFLEIYIMSSETPAVSINDPSWNPTFRKPLSHGKRTNYEKELEDRIALLEREVKQLMAFVTSHGPAKPCPNDDDDEESDDDDSDADYPADSDYELDSEDPEHPKNRPADDDDNATDGESDDSEALGATVEMAPSSSKRLVTPEYLTKKPEKRRKLY